MFVRACCAAAGPVAAGVTPWVPVTVKTTAEAAKERAEAERAAEAAREALLEGGASPEALAAAGAGAMAAVGDAPAAAEAGPLNRRCKRRRLASLVQSGGAAGGRVLTEAATSA